MTMTEFRRLPSLITRDRVKAISGLSDGDIRALVEAGTLRVWHRPGPVRKVKGRKYKAGQERGPYGRYYTVEVARLCGFDLAKC